MRRITYAAIYAASLILLSACASGQRYSNNDLPDMPMTAEYENSLEYEWSQKKVEAYESLSGMETMESWEHKGYGSLSLSSAKVSEGSYALLLESPTKGEDTPNDGRPWGVASAYYNASGADWTSRNRISFDIYPDLPGFKVVSISLVFHNDGEEKLPDSYDRNGLNYQVLENHKWNKVNWEIAHLGRDKVSGIEIRYRLQGNEPGATTTARYYIDNLRLETVEADHYEGWDVAPGKIAYNHAGYAKNYPKIALISNEAPDFTLKDATGKIVKEGAIVTENTPAGSFRVADFSDVNTAGEYVLEAGNLKTKKFAIGEFGEIYRSSIIKTINHFFTQRCGYPVPGVHDACHLDWISKHEDLSVGIHGGWHDAGDLSQGLVNTAEAAASMLMLHSKIVGSDPHLAARLLNESRWGVDWMLKTRFGDGFRNVWATKDMWTDGIIGNKDDFQSRAQNSSHANLVSSFTEALAAVSFKSVDPEFAAYALQCAEEDFAFGSKVNPERMTVEIAGAALNAALALYEATKGDAAASESYKTSAISYASYIISCQQTEELEAGVSLKGFFYRTPEKEDILHYPHRGHEQDAVVGLVRLAELFPSEAGKVKEALALYASFYKEAAALNAPYYMLPAGIYDLSKARGETEREQISNGVKLSDRYYLKRFPVWTTFRGNSGTTLTQAKGLAAVGRHLNDKALLDIVYHVFDWHLGMNPFAQSLMYGEGYRFAGQYSVTSGNLVGGLPVGIQTHFNRDAPYWPAENCYNWKEIWVHPSCRWLMLMCDFI